jgi:glycosyltransferase involved in cell wall biosynthesis
MDESQLDPNNPAISVIMPTYNQAQYISEAIQSVLGQTYPEFELVVVDDGSIDETPNILAGLQDPRLRVIRQPNAGLSAARNTGIRESSAPLVTFLDSDDYFLPDKLEVLSRFLEEHSEIDLVAGRVRYIDPMGSTIPGSEIAPAQLSLSELLRGNPICVSGVLMKRKCFESAGVFDETLRACEDWDLWLRLLVQGCQMASVDHYVAAYRIHPGQMTSQSERMRTAIFSMLDKFFNRPELPDYLNTQRNVAYASGLVHAGVYAYISNELDRGQCYLAEAVHQDPTLRDRDYERLIGMLVSWAHDPRAIDPISFLTRILSNPPPGQLGFKRQLRRALADVYLSTFFSGTLENWKENRWDLFKVILYKPSWLFNRGVVRIFVGAWFST